jgi:hypothetical protein
LQWAKKEEIKVKQICKKTRNPIIFAIVMVILLTGLTSVSYGQNQAVPAQWRIVEQIFGTSGKMQPHNVFELDLARSDLQVRRGDVTLNPALDETDFRFMRSGQRTLVVGEIALLASEISPVVLRLRQHQLVVTAVHNHLTDLSPQIYYVHFTGQGQTRALATGIRNAVSATGTPLNQGKSSSTPGPINTQQIQRVLGEKGDWSGGVFNIAVSRKETIRNSGTTLPGEMGVATEFTFQPIGNGAAVATGEIVLLANEVDPVIDSLQRSGYSVTAVHSHFLHEQPRLFYLHFWARGDAVSIATQLRAALRHTNSKLGT